jgi:CRISPR-associated protein Cmr6
MNVKYQFYRAYYDNFDPRQNAVEDRGAHEEQNKSGFVRQNEQRLYGFQPLRKAPQERLIDEFTYRPELPSLKQFCNVEPILLETTYPGLIVGTGYNHETSTEDEITIGFYFDHVSGLPVLPGSSVKGTLRAAFPRRQLDRTPSREADIRADLLLACLTQLGVPGEWTKADIDELELDIFAGQQDVFLDAYPTKTDENHRLLGPDFITPHGDNPLKNPTPLRMIKVLPQVGWRFDFRLFDTTLREGIGITAGQKRDLFRLILLMFGVGAKTNVGYGRLVDSQHPDQRLPFLELEDSDGQEVEHVDEIQPTNATPGDEKNDHREEVASSFSITDLKPTQRTQLKRGRSVWGQVVEVKGHELTLRLHLAGMKEKDVSTAVLKYTLSDKPTEGQWGECEITNIQGGRKAISQIVLKTNQFKTP